VRSCAQTQIEANDNATMTAFYQRLRQQLTITPE
jgi:hypothetical protein